MTTSSAGHLKTFACGMGSFYTTGRIARPEREHSQRRRETDLRPRPRIRAHGEDAADRSRPAAHRGETVAFTRAARLEAAAVVGHHQLQTARSERQADADRPAAGVLERVVQALLENEEDLPARRGVE